MLPPKLKRSERLQSDKAVFAEKCETVPSEIQRSNCWLQRISESAA